MAPVCEDLERGVLFSPRDMRTQGHRVKHWSDLVALRSCQLEALASLDSVAPDLVSLAGSRFRDSSWGLSLGPEAPK